jgi:hypothetical protein
VLFSAYLTALELFVIHAIAGTAYDAVLIVVLFCCVRELRSRRESPASHDEEPEHSRTPPRGKALARSRWPPWGGVWGHRTSPLYAIRELSPGTTPH